MKENGTETSSFGVSGRINHNSSKFYNSKLYNKLEKKEIEDKSVNELPKRLINRLILGTAEDMSVIPDRSLHLMITSPPYNVSKEYDEDLSLEEYLGMLTRVFRETYRVLVNGGRACINVANLGRKPYIPISDYISQIMIDLGFNMRGEIIWNKAASASPSTAWGSWMSASNPTLRDIHEYILIFSKGDYKRDRKKAEKEFRQNTISRDEFMEWTKSIWTFNAESAKRIGHPAPFPLDLPYRLIQLLSFTNDTILDPFMGSGTTAIAALKSNRKYIGFDTQTEYIRLAEKRIFPYKNTLDLGLNNNMNLKTVALNDLHTSLGAKMVEFAGYNMPVRYTSDKEEHLTVRQSVGVFDVSHMGEFMIKGEKSLDFLQKMVSNDVSKLFDGKAMYAYLPNDKGGVVDDLLIYRIKSDEYMLVVNASNIEKDWNWLEKHNDFDVEMTNISDQTSLFAVQGPKANEVLQKLTNTDLKTMDFYTFQIGKLADVDDVVISATGYTGAGGFELYVKNQDAEKVWKAIFEAGKDVDIKPIGLGARDTLRLEMGYCLYGNDIDDATSPLEAGLGWVTKFTKDFINSKNLKKQKEEGVKQKLIAFKMIDKGIPRKDYQVVDIEGETIGRVTSGSLSPSLNYGIGLAYVDKTYSKIGGEIFINIRKKQLKAEIIKLPFVEKGV